MNLVQSQGVSLILLLSYNYNVIELKCASDHRGSEVFIFCQIKLKMLTFGPKKDHCKIVFWVFSLREGRGQKSSPPPPIGLNLRYCVLS